MTAPGGRSSLDVRIRHLSLRVVLIVVVAVAMPAAFAASVAAQDAAAPRFRALSAGDHFTCGLTVDGRAYCWGANYLAQLGTAEARSTCSDDLVDAAPCSRFPLPVAARTKFVSLSAGSYHACAIDVEGAVWCWGDAEDGSLGVQPVPDLCQVRGPMFGPNGLRQCAHSPVRVPVPGRFVAISSGANTSCALDDQGTAWCWGEQHESEGPVRIPLDAPLKTLSVARGRGCGLTVSGGSVRCWRWPRERDDSFETPIEEQEWIALAVTTAHACAIAADSTAWCWGNDADAALGRGRGEHQQGTGSAVAPIAVRGHFRAIVVTAKRSCAVTGNDRLFCWGRLGRDAADDECLQSNAVPESKSCTSTPRATWGEQRVKDVTLGWTHSCALLASGESACWGANDWGELGDGTRLASAALATVVGFDRSASPTIWVRERVLTTRTLGFLIVCSALLVGILLARRWRARAAADPTGVAGRKLPIALVISGWVLFLSAFVAAVRGPHDEVSAGIAWLIVVIADAMSCLLALVGGGIAMARLRRVPDAPLARITIVLAAVSVLAGLALFAIAFVG